MCIRDRCVCVCVCVCVVAVYCNYKEHYLLDNNNQIITVTEGDGSLTLINFKCYSLTVFYLHNFSEQCGTVSCSVLENHTFSESVNNISYCNQT